VSLGTQIRKLRTEKGVKISEMSEMTGLSPSLISQVERDLASPSIGSIKKIADALGVPLAAFFNDEMPQTSPVVRKNQRKKLIPPGSGVVYELLTPNLSCAMEIIFNVFDEGATTGPEPFVHKGEEGGIVLEGQMEVTLAGRTHLLEEGDSIYFDSSIPHSYRNAGKGKLIAVWAITPPSF
jgi:transcriptional regulator with XRE-family HTH domain